MDLVNQDGESRRLADYRGRALAVTFVFTRCPLPDYCPLMMKKFTTAHAALIAELQKLRRRLDEIDAGIVDLIDAVPTADVDDDVVESNIIVPAQELRSLVRPYV